MKPRTVKGLKRLIKTVKDLNSIDTSLITDMHSIFCHATSFNQPLNNWDVSNVEDMESMFDGAASFNQPLNDWDASNVEDMESMFENATMYSHSMSNWELKSDCHTKNFLKKCIMWLRRNTKMICLYKMVRDLMCL